MPKKIVVMLKHVKCVLLLRTLSLIFLTVSVLPARADLLPQPSGDVLLTISGEISHTNADQAAVFDRAMLAALPQTTYMTSTVWTSGVHEFRGVLLTDLLAAVGANGQSMTAVAVNDYAVEIPADSLADTQPIVAYAMDGEEMSVRDKGPLWVVYNYDSSSELQSEVIYSRSIWQLIEIDIRP